MDWPLQQHSREIYVSNSDLGNDPLGEEGFTLWVESRHRAHKEGKMCSERGLTLGQRTDVRKRDTPKRPIAHEDLNSLGAFPWNRSSNN